MQIAESYMHAYITYILLKIEFIYSHGFPIVCLYIIPFYFKCFNMYMYAYTYYFHTYVLHIRIYMHTYLQSYIYTYINIHTHRHT